MALDALGKPEEAITSFDLAIKYQPELTEAYCIVK